MHGSRFKALSSTGVVALVVAACGGREPRPVPPPARPSPSDPPVVSRIASACARVSACAVGRFRDPGACVDWWLGGDPKSPGALRTCLGDAKTCDQVSACMRGGGDARAATFCGQRAGVVSGCDGDRLVSCAEDDAHESSVVDCAAIGATCREAKAGAGVVVRGCWSPQLCPAGAPETRCDGSDAVLSCRDGSVERVVCRAGTRCEERQDEAGETVATCALSGSGRCGLRGVRRCEQDRLVACDPSAPFGDARVTDCVGYGLRCAGAGPRAGCYVAASVECERELLPRCERGSLVFCAAGRLEKVACAGLGLGPCDPSANGAIAGCAPAPARAAEPAPRSPVRRSAP